MWSKAFGRLSGQKKAVKAKREEAQPEPTPKAIPPKPKSRKAPVETFPAQPETECKREGAPAPEPPAKQRSLADLLSGLGGSKKKKSPKDSPLHRAQTDSLLETIGSRRCDTSITMLSIKDSLTAPQAKKDDLKDSLTLMLDNLGEKQVRKRGTIEEEALPAESKPARGFKPRRSPRDRKSQSSRGAKVKRYDRAREGRFPRYETKAALDDPRRQSYPRRSAQSPLKALPRNRDTNRIPAWRKGGSRSEAQSPPPLVASKSSSNSDKSQTPRRDKPESLRSTDPDIATILSGMKKLGDKQARWADCCSDEEMTW